MDIYNEDDTEFDVGGEEANKEESVASEEELDEEEGSLKQWG